MTEFTEYSDGLSLRGIGYALAPFDNATDISAFKIEFQVPLGTKVVFPGITGVDLVFGAYDHAERSQLAEVLFEAIPPKEVSGDTCEIEVKTILRGGASWSGRIVLTILCFG
jgi:hypothetical protein